MTDHFSGPRAVAEPTIDFTDLFSFPSPSQPGRLGLAMDVHPAARAESMFSDAAIYRFRIRPVTIAGSGPGPRFDAGTDEYAISFTFAEPVPQDGTRAARAGGHVHAPGWGDGLLPGRRRARRARQRRTRLRRVAAGSLLRGRAEAGGNAHESAGRGGRARRPTRPAVPERIRQRRLLHLEHRRRARRRDGPGVRAWAAVRRCSGNDHARQAPNPPGTIRAPADQERSPLPGRTRHCHPLASSFALFTTRKIRSGWRRITSAPTARG
jgi:hypothetical protein